MYVSIRPLYFPLLTPTFKKTNTPIVNYDPDIFYLMGNITTLLDTTWFFGLPYDNPSNNTGISEIAVIVEDILGSSLLGFQLGNEPDLSANFLTREFVRLIISH
jgi:hypothetical protein